MSRDSLLRIVYCLLLLIITTGCRRDEDAGKMVFRFTNSQEPATLDVSRATGIYENRILNMLFEGLLRYGDEGNPAEPGVAKEFEVSDDGTKYIFHLRPGVTWSDGKEVTAHDFAAAYHRILDPKTGAEYAHMLYPIVHARELNTGDSENFGKLGAKAVDDHTLEFQLRFPVPYFPELVAHYTYFPIPRHVVAEHGDRWTNPDHIVSNGAFLLKKRVTGDRMEFAKNPRYWERDRVRLDKVVAYMTPDQEAQLRMFRSGKVDWLANPITKSAYPQLKENPSWMAPPYLGSFFLAFNTDKKPFDDRRVRRALALAVDRRFIVDKITRADETPAYNFVPKGIANYSPDYELPKEFEKNLETARELLREAGYPDGKGFPAFTLLYNTNDNNKKVCLAISTVWQRELGLENLSIENNEWKVYLAKMNIGDYDIARRGWIGDFDDAYNFLELWTADNGNNRTGWSNPKYEQLIERSNFETDIEKRARLFQQAEEVLLYEAPVIPVYFQVADQLLKPYVRGFYPRLQGDHGAADIAAGKFDINDNHPISYLWIDEQAKKQFLQEN